MKKRITHYLLFFLLSGLPYLATAQVVLRNFPLQQGGQAEGLATDAQSNFFMTGVFYNNPNITVSDKPIIRKYSPAGNLLWQGMALGASHVTGVKVAVDAAGNSYVLGTFSDAVLQLPTATALTNIGYQDLFLAKYSPTGALLWARRYGSNDHDWAVSLSCDAQGNVVFSGTSVSMGTSNFNINFGNNVYLYGSSQYDYLVKVSSTGQTLWAKQVRGKIRSSTLDRTGHIIIAGQPDANSLVFKIGPDTVAGNVQIFYIAKLNPSGTPVWVNTNSVSLPGTHYANFNGMTTDAGGSVYVTGDYAGTMGLGQTVLTGGGEQQFGFALKLNPAGALEWAQRFYNHSQASSIIPNEIKVDEKGNCLVTATYQGNTSFQGHSYITPGPKRGMVLKLDALGNYIWHIEGGHAANQAGLLDYGLTLDAQENCYISGKTMIPGVYSMGNFTAPETNGYIYKITSGEYYNWVSGRIFIDLNGNQVKDANENYAPGIITQVEPSIYTANAQANGRYSAYVDSGSYTITVPSAPAYYTLLPATHTGTFSGIGQADTTRFFTLTPDGPMQDLRISITTPATPRPGFTYPVYITCFNQGTIPMTGSVVVQLDSSLASQSTLPVAASQTGNSFTWNFSNLQPLQSRQYVVNAHVLATTPIGTSITQVAQALPLTGDLTPADNVALDTDIVTGSYDPNDKLVSQSVLTPSEIAAGKYLDYTIRFQNTGTDTAFTVRLIDTLDQQLNIPTFEVLSSSHAHTWNIRSNGIIEFRFDNILLADSNTNEPLSHGFIRYRIKPRTNLALGDIIRNIAAIYFDFNVPVITNTTATEVSMLNGTFTALQNQPLHIYPNPNKGSFTIELQQVQESTVKAELRNVLGQVVWQQQLPVQNGKLQQQVQTQNLSKGIYQLLVSTGKGTVVQKLVIE